MSHLIAPPRTRWCVSPTSPEAEPENANVLTKDKMTSPVSERGCAGWRGCGCGLWRAPSGSRVRDGIPKVESFPNVSLHVGACSCAHNTNTEETPRFSRMRATLPPAHPSLLSRLLAYQIRSSNSSRSSLKEARHAAAGVVKVPSTSFDAIAGIQSMPCRQSKTPKAPSARRRVSGMLPLSHRS